MAAAPTGAHYLLLVKARALSISQMCLERAKLLLPEKHDKAQEVLNDLAKGLREGMQVGLGLHISTSMTSPSPSSSPRAVD